MKYFNTFALEFISLIISFFQIAYMLNLQGALYAYKDEKVFMINTCTFLLSILVFSLYSFKEKSFIFLFPATVVQVLSISNCNLLYFKYSTIVVFIIVGYIFLDKIRIRICFLVFNEKGLPYLFEVLQAYTPNEMNISFSEANNEIIISVCQKGKNINFYCKKLDSGDVLITDKGEFLSKLNKDVEEADAIVPKKFHLGENDFYLSCGKRCTYLNEEYSENRISLICNFLDIYESILFLISLISSSLDLDKSLIDDN